MITSFTDFTERWRKALAGRSEVSLGVAPSAKWLAAWGLDDDVTGAQEYGDRVLDACAGEVPLVKVQTPFYLRFGARGVDALRTFVARAHDQGALVMLDAKVGDADDTMDAYADLYFGEVGGDAVTADPFLGFDSVRPLVARAAASGGAVFVLVRTSNHASDGIQRATGADGRTVAEALADAVTETGACAVVGARMPESAGLVARLPHAVIEVPGLGRADRDTTEVLAAVAGAVDRLVLPITTGVLRHGPDPVALRASLNYWRREVDQRLRPSEQIPGGPRP